jgi:hypothetical protein
MVDNIRSEKTVSSGDINKNYYKRLQPVNPIGELVKFSNEIQTEDELKWFCGEFEKHGYLTCYAKTLC